MAVDVQDVGAVLLRAGAQDQVGQADPVSAAGREFTLAALSRRDRLGINAEVAKQRERFVLRRKVSRRDGAVKNLEASECTETWFAVPLNVVRVSANPGRLIDEDQSHA